MDGFSSQAAGRSHRGRRVAAPDQRSGNGRRGSFKVIEAGNADEAIAILEARSDIHIVFTDIQMPGPMDGPHTRVVRLDGPLSSSSPHRGRVTIGEGDLPKGGLFVPTGPEFGTRMSSAFFGEHTVPKRRLLSAEVKGAQLDSLITFPTSAKHPL